MSVEVKGASIFTTPDDGREITIDLRWFHQMAYALQLRADGRPETFKASLEEAAKECEKVIEQGRAQIERARLQAPPQ